MMINKSLRKVLFIQRRIPKYRVPFFENLRDTLIGAGIELQVLYGGSATREERMKGDEAELSWGIADLKYLRLGKKHFFIKGIDRFLLKQQDMIIVPHENIFFWNHFMVLKERSDNTRIGLFGHGANFQAKKSKSWQERLKAFTAKQADWWFAYTDLSRRLAIENGFPADRVTCINNTIETKNLMAWKRSIAPDETNALRKSLGIGGDAVAVFIGSLHKEKRLTFLFQACDRIRNNVPSFEIIIMGDGSLRHQVSEYTRTRSWARWVGAKHGREKVLHMCLGNVLINPGLVGLNIIDSFALGMPMVTTNCKIHSPEIAYLQSGKNGLMTSNDVESFVSGVCYLIEDRERRNAFAAAGKEDAERYSLDHMVQNFADGIIKALNSEPLRKKL